MWLINDENNFIKPSEIKTVYKILRSLKQKCFPTFYFNIASDRMNKTSDI